MSVEVKEELRGEGETTPPSMSPPQTPPDSGIQIPLSEDMQKILVEVVIDDHAKGKSDRDKKSYGTTSKGEDLKFEEWFKRIKDLYNGNKQAKTIPWKFCSNRSLRIAAAIVDLIHARLFPAVWNEDLTRWRSMKAVDTPKTERITHLMDWWIRVWSPMRPFFDIWTKYSIGFGDVLTETSWDVEEIVTNETIDTPITDEMGQPLMEQDGTPAIQKQTKINRIEKTKSRVIQKDKVFFMDGEKDIQRDPVPIEETYLFKELEDMAKSGACINIDKLEEMMVVPEPTGNVSDEEKARIKRIKLRNMPVTVIREYLHYDYEGVGVNESIRVMVSPEHRIYLGGVAMKNVTKSGKRPLDFTKYDSYLDRPDDLDGEGILHKVRELADEVDACFNQMTDANTLGVLRPFFYDPSGDVDAPAITLGPNRGIPVTDPQKNVYFPQIDMQTERLINAIRLVMEFIERLTAASEYVMGRESGTVGGSGTATRTNAIMQSAETRFTLPSERLRYGASNILSQHLDIIQLNIQPGLEERVLGEKGEAIFGQGELTDMGIVGEYSAFLLPDPSMGSKQTERDLMNMMYQVLMLNPIVMSDPTKIYAVAYDYLKAYGREKEAVRYLGPPPSVDDIDDPEDENTLMIQGDFQRVVPQLTENHIYHIQKHMDLMKSPAFTELSATAPELVAQISEYNQQHIQQHMEMMKNLMSLVKSGGKNGGEQGGGEPGADQGGNSDTQTDAPGTSVETVGGPMGQALNSQRAGESGNPQSQ